MCDGCIDDEDCVEYFELLWPFAYAFNEFARQAAYVYAMHKVLFKKEPSSLEECEVAFTLLCRVFDEVELIYQSTDFEISGRLF